MEKPVLETNLAGLELVNRGKVRDIYRVEQHLLIVATDRISAFDCILPTGIPCKGKVLTAAVALLVRPVKRRDGESSHHGFGGRDAGAGPPACEGVGGRSMLVRKAEIIPIECVARGYLAGSAWKEYRQTGAICGVRRRWPRPRRPRHSR